jgi:hypothetical protein
LLHDTLTVKANRASADKNGGLNTGRIELQEKALSFCLLLRAQFEHVGRPGTF